MRIRRALLLAGLLGIAAVSGCTTESKGDPRPGTTLPSESATSTGDEEELPFAGAPKVDNPLDTSRYEQNPCLSLTEEQARYLSLPPTGKPMDVALGDGCQWKNEDTRGYVNVAFLVDDPRGLSPEYESRNEGEFPEFKELPKIEGYPAITREGAEGNGVCTIVVGVADDMVFEINLQLSQVNVGVEDPCEVAVEVAGLALQTMKQGA